MSAREQGDQGALAKIPDGNAGLRAIKLSEVDGRPVDVTGVSITRNSISNILHDVTVTWTDASDPVSTDRLMVPRPGDPGASPECSVSVAP